MDLKKEQWYFKNSIIVIAILSVGPFALPLAWFNPRYSLRMKILITAATIIVTYLTMILMKQSIDWIKEYYRQIGLIQ